MANILGLDITDREARAVLVRTSLRKAVVQRYVRAPVSVSRGEAGRAAEVHEAVRALMRQLERAPDTWIVGMPGTLASVRTLAVPAAAARRVGDVLPFELEPVLPFPIEEAVVDCQPIGTADGELKLLTAAVPKSHVREVLDEWQAAGVQPKQLAVGAAALDGLSSLLPELQSDQPVALIELDVRSSDVCILRDGICEMARTVSAGMQDDGASTAALVASVHRTLTAYRAAGGKPLRTLYVAGNVRIGAETLARLADALQVPVEPLLLPTAASDPDEPDPGFMRATALAGRAIARGRRINLRLGEFAPPHAASALRNYARIGAFCAAAVVLTAAYSVWAQRSLLNDEQSRLEQQLALLSKQVLGKEIRSAPQAQKMLGRASKIDEPLPKFDAFDALEVVSEAVDEEITHDVQRLRIEIGDGMHEGRLELKGTLSTIEERDKVAERLKAHKCFHEVEKGRTSPAGKERINYTLEATIRCWEARAAGKKRRRRKR